MPHVRRMSAKLFNCTPAQLPADLKANLVTMLQCGVNALEGYIRPGCVHLVRVSVCRVAAWWDAAPPDEHAALLTMAAQGDRVQGQRRALAAMYVADASGSGRTVALMSKHCLNTYVMVPDGVRRARRVDAARAAGHCVNIGVMVADGVRRARGADAARAAGRAGAQRAGEARRARGRGGAGRQLQRALAVLGPGCNAGAPRRPMSAWA